MNDLEQALRDLGDHLDHPPGDDLPGAVRERLREVQPPGTGPADGPDDRRSRAWLIAVAAALVVVLLGVAAFRPSREAIASWFGIGAVEIRQVPATTPVGSAPPPSARSNPGTATPEALAASENALRELEGHLSFRIRVPDAAIAAIPVSAGLDDRPPGGLVELRYEDFSMIEVASQPGAAPVLVKDVGPGVRVEHTDVRGHEALWLSGDPHQIAYRNREGLLRTDTVRRAGNVLVWVEGDVTYRIEGARDLTTATAIATTLH